MEEGMQLLESYFDSLRTSGKQLPRQLNEARPHFRRISAAAGIDFGYLLKEPYRQRVMLAAEEIGLAPREGTETSRREARFNENRIVLDNYLQWLKDNALKLPEDPTHRGKIFFPQVIIEAGLSPRAITLRDTDWEAAYHARLRQTVKAAATSLGLEVRLLPQSPGQQRIPITYEQLLTKGTEERKRQLKGKRSSEAQLSNTRYALNLFVDLLGLELRAPIGREFVAEFKSSVEEALGKIANASSRKKFQTEINRWQDIYQCLIKEPSIPEDINQAITHLVDRSGLPYIMLAKLIRVRVSSMRAWYLGSETPSMLSLEPLARMESLFKLSSGTLTNKIVGLRGGRRFWLSELPPFLQKNVNLLHRVRKHLPDDFCSLPLERQEEIVELIRTEITCGGGDEYQQRQSILTHLPYRLKEWPPAVREEFDGYAHFKTCIRPPLGMQRSGTWRPSTKEKTENDFGFFFGALRLPCDADDVRLRGLGFPESKLTMALLVCPKIVDWYIRFRCEVRGQYTEYVVSLLIHIISMIRPDTGWLRQSPQLALRLHPFSADEIEYVPQDLVSRAQTNWHMACDDAIKKYEELIEKIDPLTKVSRDSFKRIEGILNMKDPMKPLGRLIQAMRRDLPNRHTQPVFYHTAIRDCALVSLIVVTGLRRGTIVKLNYTGGKTGNLYLEGGKYVLSIPRQFFKNEDSSFFGPKRSKSDYFNKFPDMYGIYEILKEYLEVSRPFLLDKYHGQSGEQPLFVTSGSAGNKRKSPRMRVERISSIYAGYVEKYLVENKFRGTGIPKVMRTGPHSARHIRGTKTYRKTRSYKLAGDANQNSEQMAREHYSRTTNEELNLEVEYSSLSEN
jgi:hypothetical protein